MLDSFATGVHIKPRFAGVSRGRGLLAEDDANSVPPTRIGWQTICTSPDRS
jgi:hypothetical protein